PHCEQKCRSAVLAWARLLKPEGASRAHASTAERHFCSQCGSALWLFSPEWPELIHPFASAVDTPLPVPPEHTHLMLGSKAPWVEVTLRKGDL
ncbi:GFA family protein, partial [Pseudomonas viridiflava]|uniref:GFA family protein n=1 Tax=Pseudomonas viridiflava TaxID=33069 RepID=UPI003C6DE0E9